MKVCLYLSSTCKILISLSVLLLTISAYFHIYNPIGYDALRNVSLMMGIANSALALVIFIWGGDEEDNNED